jgi:hypothetical protein
MMRIEGLDVPRVLGGLKDFQRRTVDYVFRRMYLDEDPAYRFLIADEVGLGKTLVARGLIARALDHLHDKVDRIDVVYVCSNAAIAQQNINRLNVLGSRHFAMATRLTLLPEQLDTISRNRVNFVSFTPGTTFDMKSSGGIGRERALLYHMMKDQMTSNQLNGLLNIMHLSMGRDKFKGLTDEFRYSKLNHRLTTRFVSRFTENVDMRSRLNDLCIEFHRARKTYPWEMQQPRLTMIKDLRQMMAHVCVDALEPDLVIMDEFQRFKDLLHGESEAAELAKTLMQHESPDGSRVRVVLLSATPYRPLTFDDDKDDNHYRDFLSTLRFLLDSPEKVEVLQEELREYRNALFGAAADPAATSAARDRVQSVMISVMVRTERVGSTAQLDAMVSMREQVVSVEPADLRQMRVTGKVASAVGSQDVVEFWKSAPYILEFMKEYDLKHKLEDHTKDPPEALVAALSETNGALLRRSHFQRYQKVDPSNGRLRALADDTIGAGMWKLLWLPPSLPYTEVPEHYPAQATKALVFSSWTVVPEVIAGLLSYDAERLAMQQGGGELPHYSELTKGRRGLLRFAAVGEEGRETGMPTLLLLYPCVTLAEAVDPLRMAAGGERPLPLEQARLQTCEKIRELLGQLKGYTDGAGAGDAQWYWAAPAMLDAANYPVTTSWMEGYKEWAVAIADEEDASSAVLRRHVARFASAARGELELGPAPSDLVDVLTDLALGSPAVAALRALHRVAGSLPMGTGAMLQAAAQVASGFRSLYNVPETMALLRASDDTPYWRTVIQHGVEANIQAMLDEYAHILRESLGLLNQSGMEVAGVIAAEMQEALRIRSARVTADEIALNPKSKRIRVRQFSLRSRFALRFADMKDEGEETLARVGAIRKAFNSPFRPFVLATTSIGQEGLDFHQYCHAVYHWNLPSNPVDMEQREGRVHRFKGHAVRKNVARRFGLRTISAEQPDPWTTLFDAAVAARAPRECDLVPYWVYPLEGGAAVERRVPMLPFSKEQTKIKQLQRALAVYRLAFGQPRQEDLMVYLQTEGVAKGMDPNAWRISLEPPAVSLKQYDDERANVAARLVVVPMADRVQVSALPDMAGGAAQWNEATFMDLVFQKYLDEELTGDDTRAIEKVLDFSKKHADDIGWMTNKTGSFSPKFDKLAKRAPFALNTKGELTLLFGQLTTTPDEKHFAAEWRNELEQIFPVTDWPAHYPILKVHQWRERVDDVLDTLDWRLHQ